MSVIEYKYSQYRAEKAALRAAQSTPVRFEHCEDVLDLQTSLVDNSNDPVTHKEVDEIVRLLGPRTGNTVVHLGCGTGLYTIALGRKVGVRGHVFALDPDPKMVTYVQRRAAVEDLHNVNGVTANDRRLKPHAVEFVLVSRVLGELLADKGLEAQFTFLKRILAPHGHVVVQDQGNNHAAILQTMRAHGFVQDPAPTEHKMEFTRWTL